MIDVMRPAEAPASLASKTNYGGIDVVNALHTAFLGKCYLCETTLKPGTLDIDHRKPKADDQFPDLKFAWTNLFPTCSTHRCNLRRVHKYPEGGLLDPSGGDGVELRVCQSIVGLASNVLRGDLETSFTAIHNDDAAASNTAVELNRIHQGTGSTDRAQLGAQALRIAIEKRVMKVAGRVREFVSLSPDANERREALKIELRKHFSRRAPYTMLVRSYFGNRQEIRALFEETP